jgi:hypothetical protein
LLKSPKGREYLRLYNIKMGVGKIVFEGVE